LDAPAEAVEPGYTAVLVVQRREGVVREPHSSQSINRSAAVSRVAAGLPCLSQRTIHNSTHVTTPGGAGGAAALRRGVRGGAFSLFQA
jgi:sirohydrochlorin ferrochelatase